MASETIYLTQHSLERAKMRTRSKSSDYSRKQVEMAYTRGLRAADCTSWEKNFLEGQRRDPECEAIAFNGFCYIFHVSEDRNEALCLTVYPLPTWFGKRKTHFYHKKERIKNIKNYRAPERGRVYAADE